MKKMILMGFIFSFALVANASSNKKENAFTNKKDFVYANEKENRLIVDEKNEEIVGESCTVTLNGRLGYQETYVDYTCAATAASCTRATAMAEECVAAAAIRLRNLVKKLKTIL
jgi:hypothetical protein